MNNSHNIKNLTDNELYAILLNINQHKTPFFLDNYYDNGALLPEVADKLLVYVDNYAGVSRQYGFYVKIVANSNHLSVKGIDRIINSVIVANNGIIDGTELLRAVKKQYPSYMSKINYFALLKLMLPVLMVPYYYPLTAEWVLFNDDIGRRIIETMLINYNIDNFIKYIGKSDSAVTIQREELLKMFNSTKYYVEADDFIKYYGLSHDLLLGVMI